MTKQCSWGIAKHRKTDISNPGLCAGGVSIGIYFPGLCSGGLIMYVYVLRRCTQQCVATVSNVISTPDSALMVRVMGHGNCPGGCCLRLSLQCSMAHQMLQMLG